MTIRWIGLALALLITGVGCGNAPSVSVNAEKQQVIPGERVELRADLRDEYKGTYAVAYYWTIVTPNCGDLSNTTGYSTVWKAPAEAPEARLCQISVSIVLRDRNAPSYEEVVTAYFNLQVVPFPVINKPPQVILVVPVQFVTPNESVSVSVEATDPEGGPLTYRWEAPTGGRFSGSVTGTGAVWVAPSQPGQYTVRVIVTDQERASADAAAAFTVIQ